MDSETLLTIKSWKWLEDYQIVLDVYLYAACKTLRVVDNVDIELSLITAQPSRSCTSGDLATTP